MVASLMVASCLVSIMKSAWQTSWNWILPHLRIKNDLKLARFFLKRRNPYLPAPGICLWQQSPCHLQSPTRGIFYTLWRCKTVHDLESLNKLKFCIQASALPLPKKTKPFIIRNMHQPAREENCWNKTFGRLPQCFKCLLVEEKLTSEISITRNMFWNSYDIAEKVCFVCM